MKRVFLLSTILVFFMCSCFVPGAKAATINVANCSQQAVQTAINSAGDGDTVQVPAGNCTWTSAITMPSNKNITIRGAGIDSTNISASNNPLFLMVNADGKSWEITGFTLSGPAGPGFPMAYVISTYSWGSHCSSFRIHDNKFKDCQTVRDGGCIEFRGNCYGVIDHNQFIGTGPAKVAIDVNSDDANNADWTGTTDLGGSTAVYIENNYFEIVHNARYLSDGQWANWNCVDTNNGGRYVARYNVFKNCYIGGHSSCNNWGPGSLKQEVYNNWVWMETGYNDCAGACGLYQGAALGSGTGIYANNVFEGFIKDSAWIRFWNDRSDYSSGCQVGHWDTPCNGTSALDQNQLPTGTYEGYTCRTQPGLGAGPFPTFMPIYIWGNHGCFNTVTTPTVDCKTDPKACYEQAYANCMTNISDIVKQGVRFSSKHFLLGRDYYLQASPAWQSYPYPHPLTLSGPLQSCSSLIGTCCQPSEMCTGIVQYASDCPTCCTSGSCQVSLCGNGQCDSGECNTCPGDCSLTQCCGDGKCQSSLENCQTCTIDCLSGGQVCCSGIAYTGTCCSDSNCTSSQVCTNHVCSQPPAGGGLVAEYSFDEGSGNSVSDSSGNGNTGTVSGPTWVAGKYGSALSFDGADDYVQIPDSASLHLSDFTLSFWLNVSSWPTINPRLITKKNSWGSMDWELLHVAWSNSIGMTVGEMNGDEVLSNLRYSPPTGAWHHIAITKNGTTYTLYGDGVSRGTDTSAINWTDSDNIFIGKDGGASGYAFPGLIDELRIYNRALSQSEIQADMNTPINCHKSDNNPCDGCVSMTELSAFMNRWYINNQDVTMKELIEAIGLWNKGCS